MTPPSIEIADLVKDYRGLRPLRILGLSLTPDEPTAILGLDEAAAAVMVDLLTAAALPDRGEVRVFGRPTSAIQDSGEWLRHVDRFGLVSVRAVLLESLSVVQNLAMPFSLDIQPPAAALRAKALRLAADVGLAEDLWDRPVAGLTEPQKVKVRLARAVAFDPPILLLEHPTASVGRHDVTSLGRDVRALVGRRSVAALTLTADLEFATGSASRVLTLDPASGKLAPRRRWL